MDKESIKTGFNVLDSVLGGYKSGTINVIASRGNAGKTSIALNIAKKVARNTGKAVVFYSGKETKSEITERLIKSSVRNLCCSKRLETINDFTARIAQVPLYINDMSASVKGYSHEQIIEDITKLKADGVDIGLIIIDDYERIIRFSGLPGESRSDDFFASTSALKNMAREFGIPLLLVTDIPYIFQYRGNLVPDLRELRDYLPYEQYADTIVFITKPEYSRDEVFPVAQLIIAKNRFGERDVSIKLDWNDKRLEFTESASVSVSRSGRVDSDNMIHCRYTFENFVVGKCNRFAYKTAVSVVEDPENAKTNPFLLWSYSGQGKTHLLKAMEKALKDKYAEKKVKYVTAEAFTNDFLFTISSHQYSAFRDKYRTVDYLLVDDIEQFENKDGIQTEFYNTVVALMDSGKHLVVTTNKMPSELDEILNPTLAVRLISGVVAGIESPDIETRRKIAQNIIDREEIKIDKPVVDYICKRSIQNVSRLKCAMNIICEYIRYDAEDEINVDLAQKLLSPLGGRFKERELTADRIIDEVAKYYDTSREVILNGPKGFSDNPSLYAAVYLCHEMLDDSEDALKIFGKDAGSYVTKSIKGLKRQFAGDVHEIKDRLKLWQHGIAKDE